MSLEIRMFRIHPVYNWTGTVLSRYYPLDALCSVHAEHEDTESKHWLVLLAWTPLLISEGVLTQDYKYKELNESNSELSMHYLLHMSVYFNIC